MYSSDVLVCLNDIPMCFNINPLCFSAHGQWSSGSEGQLSDSPSEWPVLITSYSALKRHGAWTISCTSRCDTNKHDQTCTKLLFSLLFIFFIFVDNIKHWWKYNIFIHWIWRWRFYTGILRDVCTIVEYMYIYVLDRLSVHWN